MPGLFNRVLGRGPTREAGTPPFTLELPDGWAGGHGNTAYMDALRDYALAHPECRDRVKGLLENARADHGTLLYAAAAAWGPEARLVVTTGELPRDSAIDDALEESVATNLEAIVSRKDLVGAPTATRVDRPYPGRVVRWSWDHEGAPPSSFTAYVFAADGRLWELTFGAPTRPLAASDDETFRAIASSFRAT